METNFKNSVDILVRAYLNDTLKHGDCTKCAVGNILSGYGLKKPFEWMAVVMKVRNNDVYLSESIIEEGREQISITDYTDKQIEEIEAAFEKCKFDVNPDQYMLNGLYAVVDVLAKIHNVDLSIKEEAKELFVKA